LVGTQCRQDELQGRYSSLCNIHEEIARVGNHNNYVESDNVDENNKGTDIISG
jgi:hypothetical protein